VTFRLLVVDIDGTLLTSTRDITPRALDALHTAQRSGVRVCLATGRMWRSAEPYFRRVGADPPAILYNGGLVYDFQTDTVLRRVMLAYDQARVVLELLRTFPTVQPHLYVNDRVYTGRTNEYTEQYRRKDSLQVEDVGDLVAFLPPDPMKILIIGPHADLLTVREQVTRLPIPINAIFSEDTFLEILPQGSSKGVALQWVARHLQIPLPSVMAVGDYLNDLEMIHVAGFGVAMGNAPEEVKAQADFVTTTNDAEGVANVIEQFVVNRPKARTTASPRASRATTDRTPARPRRRRKPGRPKSRR
jgi:Cof subfamily protein (haloacid dehalogenase superfamily)